MIMANQICIIECAYDAVGCAYLIGLQKVSEYDQKIPKTHTTDQPMTL